MKRSHLGNVLKKMCLWNRKNQLNQSHNPELDDAVLRWFKEMRDTGSKCKPLPLSRAHIEVHAAYEAKLRGIYNLKASDGWFCNWQKRCLISPSPGLFRETGNVNIGEREPPTEVSFKLI